MMTNSNEMHNRNIEKYWHGMAKKSAIYLLQEDTFV